MAESDQQRQEREAREKQQQEQGGGERRKPGEVPDDTREVLENAGQQPTQTRSPEDEDYEPRRTGTGREGSPDPEHPHGGPPGQTGQNPGQSGGSAQPPGQQGRPQPRQ